MNENDQTKVVNKISRQRIVAGNWKMNGSLIENQALLSELTPISGVTTIVFPPYIYLLQISELLANNAIQYGAQNLAQFDGVGAYTGEVSATMLKEFGCRYVLVGHSERRTIWKESNEEIAQKFAIAKAHGLMPILCVGETLQEREAGLAESVLKKQLSLITDWENSIIAYEPVWAIGTGVTATPEQAQAMHAYIRSFVPENISILYGGSVKASNAATLFAMPDIDGALVGGASLNAQEFMAIVSACNG